MAGTGSFVSQLPANFLFGRASSNDSLGQPDKRPNEGAAEGERAAKRVRVLVGKDQTPSSVYKDTICEKSKFFETACSTDRWREGKENTVPLPDVEPGAFKTYLHSMYTGKLLAEVH